MDTHILSYIRTWHEYFLPPFVISKGCVLSPPSLLLLIHMALAPPLSCVFFPSPPCVISLCASQTNVYRTTEGGEGNMLSPHAIRASLSQTFAREKNTNFWWFHSSKSSHPLFTFAPPPPEKAEGGGGGEKLRRNFPSQLDATLVGKDGLCQYILRPPPPGKLSKSVRRLLGKVWCGMMRQG